MENGAMNPARAILLCGILLTGCATSAEGPWEASIQSSGGITGRGNGGLLVTSDGILAVTTPNGKVCEFDVPPQPELDELIARARPQRWSESYEGPCADCFDWRLTLTRGEHTYTTSWNDVASGRPPDLVRLANELLDLENAYGERCRREEGQ
jgi:hypothetical protein